MFFGCRVAALDFEEIKIAQFDQEFSRQPQRPAGNAARRLRDFAGVLWIPVLPDALGLDAGADSEQSLELQLAKQTPALAAQHFVGLHRAPLVENQRLQAGRKKHRLVAAVPAVFRQRAVDVDNFFAFHAVSRPKNRVAENRKILAEPARRRQAGGFQQHRAK